MPRFIRNIIIAFLPFLIIGILFAYYNFIVYPNLSGDLGNIGKIEFGNQYYDDFSKPVLNNYKVIDIINSNEKSPGIFTFGDSFSQRGINGYQNFAANMLDTTIVNFKNTQLDVFGNSAEQKAISMLNEGVFDSIPNSILIIESGERYFPRRILSLDFDAVTTEENVRPRDDTKQRMEKGFSDWLKYKIGFADNPVYHAKLNKKLFSHPQYSSDLFFFYEDLEKRDLEPEEIDIIGRNLDKMREKFLQKNIRLVYVIVPDKYDVYKDYIINNGFGEKKLSDQIKLLQKQKDWIIFPLEDMKEKVRAGEQDLFYVNDTHWTYKGACILGEVIARKIKEIKN